MYRGRLDRVVLFGSRAVILGRISITTLWCSCGTWPTRGPELHRLVGLSTDIIGEAREFVHAMPYRTGAYDGRTPLMRGIRCEGIELWRPKLVTFLPKAASGSAKPVACWR
jgi:hypothetical protein